MRCLEKSSDRYSFPLVFVCFCTSLPPSTPPLYCFAPSHMLNISVRSLHAAAQPPWLRKKKRNKQKKLLCLAEIFLVEFLTSCAAAQPAVQTSSNCGLHEKAVAQLIFFSFLALSFCCVRNSSWQAAASLAVSLFH